ncbi:hypothetical protein PFISCL1PPCAC_1062, partial [Pristionchus fissidentatus]
IIAVLLIAGVCAEWSAWTETPDSPCSETCGYCGVRVVATRTCTAFEFCSGVSQRYEECAARMCKWPNRSCCAGYVKAAFDGQITCVAKAGAVVPKTKLT